MTALIYWVIVPDEVILSRLEVSITRDRSVAIGVSPNRQPYAMLFWSVGLDLARWRNGNRLPGYITALRES